MGCVQIWVLKERDLMFLGMRKSKTDIQAV